MLWSMRRVVSRPAESLANCALIPICRVVARQVSCSRDSRERISSGMGKKDKDKTVERPPTLKERTHQVSVYLEPVTYEQLRAIAYAERTKMHSLILEGIDMVMKKRAKRNAA